jgi:1-acyl-sn-glycerol-3-phosphate acyltransferase
LRAVLSVPLIVVITVGFGIPSIVAGFLDPTGGLAFRMARRWARLVLRACSIQVLVHGVDNMPTGPAVYAANHGSAADIPILFGYLPAEFRVVHKRSLYLLPVVGLYLYAGGHISIERANPFRARKSLARAIERIRGGTSLVVFPEGTRSPDERVRPFKRGTFVLAAKSGVPVVPLSLVGVKRVVPGGFLRIQAGTVELRIHPALPTAGRAAGDAAALADEVRRIVSEGCGQA